jgi:hypothetical protein
MLRWAHAFFSRVCFAVFSKFLEKLKTIAADGAPSHAQLAVECIQNLWGAPRTYPDCVRLARENGGTLPQLEETEADQVLREIFREHAVNNMKLDAPQLQTALAVAARIAEVNYPLLQNAAATYRTLMLNFLLSELLPCSADQLVPLHDARIAALGWLEKYLVAHGRFDQLKPKEDAAAPASKSGDSKADPLDPKHLATTLLKIVKLDGRFPEPGKNTVDQLREATDREESDEETEARLEFLLAAGFAILECCTVAVYHRLLIHPSPESLKEIREFVEHRKKEFAAAKDRSSDVRGMLSPRAAPSEVKVKRHLFHFGPVAMLAVHYAPELSKRFIERVIELLKAQRLSSAWFISVVTLAASHPSYTFSFNHVKAAVGVLLRFQRHHAKAIEDRQKQHQDALSSAAASVAASAKKKGSRKKKKGDDEDDDEMEDETASHVKHPANAAMPEYAIADLIYLLSYHPEFLDEHVLVSRTVVSGGGSEFPFIRC